MSALLDNLPRYRRMTADDLDAVLAIEHQIYPYPWTPGNFSDSLDAGYHCWVMELGGVTVAYGIVMIAVNEAHLLNLGVAAAWQRRGLGREMVKFLLQLARDLLAQRIYLEVRLSNVAGRALYADAGFKEIAARRGYYPAAGQHREDAMVMEMELT